MRRLDLENLLSPDAADRPRRDHVLRLLREVSAAPELHGKADSDWVTAQQEAESPEFLWRGLVRVHTTVRGVQTYAWFMEPRNQPLWTHAALRRLDPETRRQRFMYLAHTKLPHNKRVQALMDAFDKLADPATLAKQQAELRELRGAENKISYFNPPKRKGPYKGIGPKYARLFWLDIADPEVSALHVALDSRVQQVLPLVWPHLDSPEGEILISGAALDDHLYCKLERAVLDLARDADILPWRADRILFHMFAKETAEQYRHAITTLLPLTSAAPAKHRPLGSHRPRSRAR